MRHANQDEAVFQKMRRLVYDHVARTVAIQRTSLASPPTVDSLAQEFKKLMDELTPETREALGHAFGPIAAGQDAPIPGPFLKPRANWTRSIATTPKRFSKSWMESFPALRRWTAWASKSLPNRRVQFLFEEAHRCYLYGFHLACAVFCRAILEGALKEVVDPQSETNQSIHDMIGVAVEKSLLTDDRPRCAREVAKAGNRAIHDPEMFDRDYSAEKVEEILTNTRKVLEELYRLPS